MTWHLTDESHTLVICYLRRTNLLRNWLLRTCNRWNRNCLDLLYSFFKNTTITYFLSQCFNVSLKTMFILYLLICHKIASIQTFMNQMHLATLHQFDWSTLSVDGAFWLVERRLACCSINKEVGPKTKQIIFSSLHTCWKQNCWTLNLKSY